MGVLKKLFIAILPLLATACYQDFTPGVESSPVLCINSMISEGEPIEVSLSHTWLFTDDLENSSHEVDDATVTIYANGEVVGAAYLPKHGDAIKIVAESPRYGKAEAAVTVPQAPQIIAPEWTVSNPDIWVTEIPEWDTAAVVTFDLRVVIPVHDIEGADYYHIDFEPSPDSENLNMGVFLYEAEPIFSEHIGLLESIGGADAYGFTLFTDRMFKGSDYHLKLNFERMGCLVHPGEESNCSLTFTLSAVSPSYYNWSNYRWQLDSGIIADLGDIGLGDPVWGYSNVSTGAGVVAARSQITFTIDLSDFIHKLTENL